MKPIPIVAPPTPVTSPLEELLFPPHLSGLRQKCDADWLLVCSLPSQSPVFHTTHATLASSIKNRKTKLPLNKTGAETPPPHDVLRGRIDTDDTLKSPTPEPPQTRLDAIPPLPQADISSIAAELRDLKKFANRDDIFWKRMSSGAAYRETAMTLAYCGCADGWWALGQCIRYGTLETVNGRKLSQRECYLEALQCDSKHSLSWLHLANDLLIEERGMVNVCGRTPSQRECYLEALTLDGKLSDAWYNLSLTMSAEERVKVNGREVTRRDCYLEAVTHDATNPDAWYWLGRQLRADERVTVNGREMNNRDCCVEAINQITSEHNSYPYRQGEPKHSFLLLLWNELLQAMSADERVTVGGLEMDKHRVRLEAWKRSG